MFHFKDEDAVEFRKVPFSNFEGNTTLLSFGQDVRIKLRVGLSHILLVKKLDLLIGSP